MSLKKILLAISLMAVVACMGGASACPCSDWALNNPGVSFNMQVEPDQPVGHQICVEAPAAPTGETWAYEWMVYVEGIGWKYSTDPLISGAVTVSADGRTICVTPPLAWCEKTVAVRVTIQTTTGGQSWARCIFVLCVEWKCVNPPCVTMTDFCQGEADSSNLPVGVNPEWTYKYSIDGDTPADMTVGRLNALGPGPHVICVYTVETGLNPGDEICTPCLTITVYAKPSGSVSVTHP